MAFKTIRNIHVLIFDYIGILHGATEYYIRGKDIKFVARGGTPDWKEIVLVMSGYGYRLNILPPIENPIIFDIGAHIGSFSLYAFEYYKFTNPRIVIFEPDKESNNYKRSGTKLQTFLTKSINKSW